MSIRKIQLTVNGNDLSEVLKSLRIKDSDLKFTIELEIEDTKENYKYLSTSELIQDWDFINEPMIENNTLINRDDTESKENWAARISRKLLSLDDITKFLILLVQLKIKSPGFNISTYNLDKYIWPNFNSIDMTTFDSIIVRDLVASYYYGSNISEVVDDILQKITKKSIWKEGITGPIDLIKNLFKYEQKI